MRRRTVIPFLLTATALACTVEIVSPKEHAKDFDLNGPVREVRVTTSEPNGDRFVDTHSLLRFDRAGRTTYHDDGEVVIQYRYDRAGRLILKQGQEKDDDSQKVGYELHKFVTPNLERITQSDGNEITSMETRRYDHGRLVEVLLEQEDWNDHTFRRIYEYDDHGREVRVAIAHGYPVESKRYDDEGHVAEFKECYDNGCTTITYTYSMGQLVSEEVRGGDHSPCSSNAGMTDDTLSRQVFYSPGHRSMIGYLQGTKASVTEQELDEDGRLIHETTSWDGDRSQRERWIEYELDTHRNWTAKKTFESQSAAGERNMVRVERRTITYY